MFDTVKRAFGMEKSVGIAVGVCPADQREALIEACDNEGIDRWLYAGTPTSSDKIWLLGGDADEPYYNVSKEKRVADAISHETMHIVLSFVEGGEASDQYDDLLCEVLLPSTYLHYYARPSQLAPVSDDGE